MESTPPKGKRSPAIELAGPALEPGSELNDRLAVLLDDVAPAAIEEIPGAVRIFFFTPEHRDRAAAAIQDFASGEHLSSRHIDVADEDWAVRSQASLTAVTAGRIIIAPPWDQPPAPPDDAIVITILPSTGFGTGHHASTRLALRALQERALAGRVVLDIGTGSGVLALAARRLGARRVIAVDVDGDAIEAARDNLTLNQMDGVEFSHLPLEELPLETADLVVANLTGPLLCREAGRIGSFVGPGGHLVLAGFSIEEEDAVRGAFARFQPASRFQEAEWIGLVLESE